MKKILLVLCSFYFTYCEAQNYEWVKSTGGINTDWGKAIVADAAGNTYVTGTFSGTIDIDPGPAINNITSAGGLDTYIQKLDTAGNLVWAGKIGGTNSDYSTGIALDSLNNIFIYGAFTGTCDFHPGAPIINVTGNPSFSSIFFLKLDNNGNFLWVGQCGGAGISSSDAGGFVISPSGYIYCSGFFSGTVDFDPTSSSSTLTSTSSPSSNLFIQKLDLNGNFIWAKSIVATVPEGAQTLAIDSSENVYLTGTFSGTVDFDPGAGTVSRSSLGASDIFIEKLDSAGNFLWVKSMGSTSNEDVYAVAADHTGNVYTTGTFAPSFDFDPGIGVFNLTTMGSNDIFIEKLDSAGNFVWAKQIGGSSYERAVCMRSDGNNYIYLSGSFASSPADFDPGPGINNIFTHGISDDLFLCKLDNSGNAVWAVGLGGNGPFEVGSAFSLTPSGDILLTGQFSDTTDFDSGPGVSSLFSHGDMDAFVLRLNQDRCSNLILSIDSVSNVSCTSSQGYSSSHALSGLAPYHYSWNTSPPTLDSLCFFNNHGLYQLTVTDSNGCTRANTIMVGGASSGASFDLDENLVAAGFRPGRTEATWLNVFNHGCVPVSGMVQLVLDPSLAFNHSLPFPDLISGDTLSWNFSDLVYDSTYLHIHLYLTVSSTAAIGDTVCLNMLTSPLAGDFDPSNNQKTYCYHIVNSYDPNIKSVYPVGSCTNGYVAGNQLLTYTVNFQNTGNADAIDIFVLDTLDTSLDISTVRVIGNSDPVITEVLPGNVLKFRFDNIHLPDSTSDEPNSHGYVIYEAMPLPSLASGTEIRNKAGIYFDFNPPVYTNSVLNTIIDVVPTACSATGISATTDMDPFTIYPNPTTNSITISTKDPMEITIMNMLGEVLMRKMIRKETVIDISNFNNGIYFIRGENGAVKKVLKQ